MRRLGIILLVAWTVLAASCGRTELQVARSQPPTAAPASTAPAEVVPAAPVPAQSPVPATNALAPAPTLPPPSPTTMSPPPPEVTATAAVAGFYAALNRGERPETALPADADTESYLLVASGYLNAVFSQNCTAGEALGGVLRVECKEVVLDDLYGPAGILLDGSVSFSVYGDRIDIDDGYACRPPPELAWEYLREFDRWLVEDGHPSALGPDNGVELDPPCSPYPFGADAAETLVELAAEFRDDSDRYPIGASEALATVNEYYEQIASGNWDVVRKVHPLGSVNGQAGPSMWLDQAIAFNATFEHDCRIERTTPALTEPTAVHVRCVEVMHDDFFAPGGISRESAITYAVEGNTMRVSSGRACWAGEPSGFASEYIFGFQQWRRAHGHTWVPGIMTLIGSSPADVPCGPYPFVDVPNAETVALVRSLLAEFVAASPDWPRSD